MAESGSPHIIYRYKSKDAARKARDEAARALTGTTATAFSYQLSEGDQWYTAVLAVEEKDLRKARKLNWKPGTADRTAGLPPFVGTLEAADILDVERPRIGRWANRGVMPPPHHRIAASPVWRRADIEALKVERLPHRRGEQEAA